MDYLEKCYGVTWGPLRGDDLPEYVTWKDEEFTTPDDADLERMALYGDSYDLQDCNIEPDGVSYNGCPSWLLALGLI